MIRGHDVLRRVLNDESRTTAGKYLQPWSNDELEWLASWDGTEEYLSELAEMLGRTIESCRQRFYAVRKSTHTVTETETHTTTTYRGWKEGDGDGWD